MDWQTTLKKYGVWLVAGALVLYLVYRQIKGGTARPLIAPAPPGAPGFSADQYRLETERLRQSGALDLARLQQEAALEAARLRAANERYNLEQQALARNRVLEAQSRGQTLGLIGSIANSLANLFKGQQTPTQGRQTPTPSTFPGGGTNPSRPQLPPAPSFPVPEPQFGASVFNSPTYVPDWPAPPTEYPLSVTDWGEAPQFGGGETSFDTGASFVDQYAGVGYDYNEAFYSFDFSEPESLLPEVGSSFEEVGDPYADWDYWDFVEAGAAPGGGGGGYTPGIDSFDFGGGGYDDTYYGYVGGDEYG